MKSTLLVAALVCAAPFTFGETTDKIIADSTEKMAGYKTWSADYLQTISAMGGKMTITGEISSQPPGKMRLDIAMPMMGQVTTMTMIMGDDGIIWQDMNMAGQRQVMKLDIQKAGAAGGTMGLGGGDPAQQMDPTKQWKAMQEMFEFVVLPAGQLHDQAMHVVEGTIKQAALTNRQAAIVAQMMGKLRVHVGQQDGFTHLFEMFDKAGSNVVMSQEFKNLKFNEDLPADTFQFTPPPGVTIVDMTEMTRKLQQNMQAPPPEPTPAPAPPATD